jgi:hypothetical protein
MSVMLVNQVGAEALARLLLPRGLAVVPVADGAPIPGTYWGEPEAGLVGGQLFVRPDTPVHSALHEAAHFICMGPERQAILHRDAGGDCAEEDAVCYLQVLLGDELAALLAMAGKGPTLSRARVFADMDAWGYSFRLGSARAWFEQDADEARTWLARAGLLTDGVCTWQPT